uniref:Si:dkey-17e16.15 n=1 Tax=Paramormyrops kingsleyae TaxID=1676925 RepID=A0A3B3RZA9_9TELE
MATEQPDALVLGAEVLLAEAAQVQMRCWEQSTQLSAAAAQLQHESQVLQEQCGTALVDMAELRGKLEELLDTKAAFEARERQARKLSKQL